MRRFFVPALIVSGAILGIAVAPAVPRAAEKNAATESESTEAKDESAKKDSDSAKKDSSATSDAASKNGKAATKVADKADQAEKDKKDKEKATAEAAAKEKTAKSEEKPGAKPDAKPAAKKEPKKRKTFKVEPKRLKVDVPLDGMLVARKMEEVPLRPKTWSDYEIVDVIEHGAKVHKGERLIKFDSEKINEALTDLELDQHLTELAIVKAEEDMPRLEKTLKLDFEDTDRSNQHANEDFKRYNEVDRPMAVKLAEFMVKYYKFMVDNEKDELRELEKMYKADDLTEETEEIVLKRQRNQLEFAEFNFEQAKIESDEMIKVYIPRADIRIKESLDRSALAKARAQMALSLDLDRARYEQEQRKKMRSKSMDRHTKLLGDKELMEIESPADGIVYYGQCVNGRWSDTPSLINRYKPHSNVPSGAILMTIVQMRPLYVTSTVDETKRPEVAKGQKIKAALPAEGGDRIGGDVTSISPIPTSPGKFEINFDIKQDEIPDWVVPGMSCKVQVTTYDKKDALVVPKKAVHDDKDDPDRHYVWLVDADDEDAKPQRRNVKLGKRKAEDVEILKGLKKGDVISLDDESEKPAEKDAEKSSDKEEKE